MYKTLDAFDSKQMLSQLQTADNNVITQALLDEAKMIKFSSGPIERTEAKIQDIILTIQARIDSINDEHKNIYGKLCTIIKDWPINHG